MAPPLNILLADDETLGGVFHHLCAQDSMATRSRSWPMARRRSPALAWNLIRFDLLITDHSMPGMTGVELVQRLREESFRGKIMVLSAHLSAEIRAAYEALAVDAMMSKPFDVSRAARHGHAACERDRPSVGEEPDARDDRLPQHA